MKHIYKLLDLYEKGVLQGYTHSSWNELAAVFRQLSPFLEPEEHQMLGSLWSTTWMEPANLDQTTEAVASIKDRLEYRN